MAATREVLPGAAWAALPGPLLAQRVQGHPQGSVRRPKGEAGREAQLPSAPEERHRCDEILADLRDVASRAVRVLIAAMRLYMRTSNYLERLNREIERHACFVGVFPSKASAIRLIESVLTEENECSSTQRKSYYG
ncbi:transposase [Atopobium sp. oral taxon 416]|uniref:transposase n=1 Tax=Atopobium sp. oral taxon 416 TaxID=712157 RepID=UPI001BAA8BA9|nr:transposase [Atopobium sp. oral taxon 416]QUC04357.1 transposase [Atopobium sp. oral taxon 416]